MFQARGTSIVINGDEVVALCALRTDPHNVAHELLEKYRGVRRQQQTWLHGIEVRGSVRLMVPSVD
jgi:hypothetical protein